MAETRRVGGAQSGERRKQQRGQAEGIANLPRFQRQRFVPGTGRRFVPGTKIITGSLPASGASPRRSVAGSRRCPAATALQF